MEKKICKKNQFAHCKYGQFCFYDHEDRKCRKAKCLDRSCIFRHPASCRNILQKKNCPWGSSCSFDHGGDNSCCETKELETSVKDMKYEIIKFKTIVIEKDAVIQRLKMKIVGMTKLDTSESDESDNQSITFSQFSDIEPVETEINYACD